ncbi:MAG TPA: 3-methyl-2-oxobutanoate hydroxymethyltransferase, partial [Anaerolineae bacterium]
HCRAVRRGAQYPFLIGDMPFMSYQADRGEAVRNAGRFLKEAGMDAIKLEGGREVAETVAAIDAAGIQVIGHIGFTPQSVSKLGGYRVQGRSASGARKLLEDALALQDAGVVMLVMEMVPDRLAAEITRRLRIPTIGIGAGAGCDGQVLVLHDLLGLFDRFTPRFAKRYAHLLDEMGRALGEYREDVVSKRFPLPEHAFAVDDATWASWLAELAPEAVADADKLPVAG